MSKKPPRKRLLLLATTAAALGALTAPSLAAAASWGVIGTTHDLDSPTVSFEAHADGVTWECTEMQLHVHVKSASDVGVTDARFPKDCHGNGGVVSGCTVTPKATGLPWTMTAPTTTNIQIHGVLIDFQFEHRPGTMSCGVAGITLVVTGTLTGGVWHPAQHQITFNRAHGLTVHGILAGPRPVTMTGNFTDTPQTLTLT